MRLFLKKQMYKESSYSPAKPNQSNLLKVLRRFFDFYGIDKCPTASLKISPIQLREMIIKIGKEAYSQGLCDSHIIFKEVELVE